MAIAVGREADPGTRRMPSRVFISYRRDLSEVQALLVKSWLETTLDPGEIFLDRHGIEGGDDFDGRIRSQIDNPGLVCAVVLIPPGLWSAECPESGRPRWDENDYLLKELKLLLRRTMAGRRSDGSSTFTLLLAPHERPGGGAGHLPTDADVLQVGLSDDAKQTMLLLRDQVQLTDRGTFGQPSYRDLIVGRVDQLLIENGHRRHRIRTISDLCRIDSREQVIVRQAYADRLSRVPRAPDALSLAGLSRLATQQDFRTVAQEIEGVVVEPEHYAIATRKMLDRHENRSSDPSAPEAEIGSMISDLTEAYWRSMVLLIGAIAHLGGERPRNLRGVRLARRVASGYLYNCAMDLGRIRELCASRGGGGVQAELTGLSDDARVSLKHAAVVWYYVLKDYFEGRGVSIWTQGSMQEYREREEIARILKSAFDQEDFDQLRADSLVG